MDAIDFVASRRPVQPSNTLAAEAQQWLQTLPESVRPTELPETYGRIVNALCKVWARPQACLALFDELVIDRRGGRQGFPGGIALEIAALKDHYETHVHATQQTPWDHIRAHSLQRR